MIKVIWSITFHFFGWSLLSGAWSWVWSCGRGFPGKKGACHLCWFCQICKCPQNWRQFWALHLRKVPLSICQHPVRRFIYAIPPPHSHWPRSISGNSPSSSKSIQIHKLIYSSFIFILLFILELLILYIFSSKDILIKLYYFLIKYFILWNRVSKR